MVALMLTGKMSDEERRTTEIRKSKIENGKSKIENREQRTALATPSAWMSESETPLERMPNEQRR